ncbi:uncharacterized protein EV420DRAFT_1680369 [Desarmillaria tabescens]|uniref:Uncharacterized protein n=1 Tax=Armillaria tabescens TaxID=1929756 RepID=A0AA39KC32_ARMTA|nr:uncharacterized protein EV420DRAFT_1680369 [Desarmillaria tabescens]KAK0458414.1 hypothetical protein EV420DRAFT_1680369 [Desarmillaria tabescens]
MRISRSPSLLDIEWRRWHNHSLVERESASILPLFHSEDIYSCSSDSTVRLLPTLGHPSPRYLSQSYLLDIFVSAEWKLSSHLARKYNAIIRSLYGLVFLLKKDAFRQWRTRVIIHNHKNSKLFSTLLLFISRTTRLVRCFVMPRKKRINCWMSCIKPLDCNWNMFLFTSFYHLCTTYLCTVYRHPSFISDLHNIHVILVALIISSCIV